MRRIGIVLFALLNLFFIKKLDGKILWNFTIDTHWNSIPIDDHLPVEFSLSSTDNQSDLLIDIDAPFFDDTPPPEQVQDLWNYEVVEMFFLSSSNNHYIELEFSPHGFYLVLLLNGRRQVFKDHLTLQNYSSRILSTNRWIGHAEIPRAHFPANIDRFNAYAIHGEKDNRTYESLYPAPIESEQADFHRLELFRPINFSFLLDLNNENGDSWKTNRSPILFVSRQISFASFFLFLVRL